MGEARPVHYSWSRYCVEGDDGRPVALPGSESYDPRSDVEVALSPEGVTCKHCLSNMASAVKWELLKGEPPDE